MIEAEGSQYGRREGGASPIWLILVTIVLCTARDLSFRPRLTALARIVSAMSATSSDSARSVSVVIPTHERPARLARCLAALADLDTDGLEIEVVVVDDGSRVAPTAEVEAVADRLDVRLHSQSNAGPAGARNAGARLASHELLAFTDDDCVPHPGWVRESTAPLAAGPGALVGGTTINAVDRVCPDASQYLIDALYRWQATHPIGAFWTSNNLACSRDSFLEVGGFDESFPIAAGEDRELGVRWSRSGRPLHRAPAAVVDHHHDMGLGAFWRQHRNYGRGAAQYRDAVEASGESVDLMPPSFYATLLAEPYRHESPWRATVLSALIGVSQIATAVGFVVERRA